MRRMVPAMHRTAAQSPSGAVGLGTAQHALCRRNGDAVRISLSAFQAAFSGEGGRFGRGMCVDLSVPHANMAQKLPGTDLSDGGEICNKDEGQTTVDNLGFLSQMVR